MLGLPATFKYELYVCIASDHRGFNLKADLINALKEYSIEDLGCYSEEPCDYPDIVCRFAENISGLGILICNTGIGMSISANTFINLAAALCMNDDMAYLARLHNNANTLIIPAKYIDSISATKIVRTFLNTQFGKDEKNIKRLEKIKKDY